MDTERLKQELKQMKIKADKCENTDYRIGYISAVSTIEGWIAICEDESQISLTSHKAI